MITCPATRIKNPRNPSNDIPTTVTLITTQSSFLLGFLAIRNKRAESEKNPKKFNHTFICLFLIVIIIKMNLHYLKIGNTKLQVIQTHSGKNLNYLIGIYTNYIYSKFKIDLEKKEVITEKCFRFKH